METSCTQESVLEFLTGKGGRVRNEELTDHFKEFLTGEKERSSFTQFVDNIAYFEQENGEKVVCLKTARKGDPTHAQHPLEDHLAPGVLSPGKQSILGFKEHGQESYQMADDVEGVMDVSDITLVEVTGSDSFAKLKAEEIGKGSSEKEREAGREMTSCPGKLEQDAVACPSAQLLGRRRISRGSQRSLDEADSSGADVSTPRCSRRSFVELMMSSCPQVRHNLVHRSLQGQMARLLRSDGESGSVEEECTLVTLDPLEHEWMMCTSDGEWDSLQRLLVCEPGLVNKKDFVTGFTCLHWAAKQGKHELLALLVTFAQQHSVAVNVNIRSSAGYTPLHLAAMHNHVEVMKLLVGAYDADLEARDYSGRKPSQYLHPSVAGDIQEIIGACRDLDAENAEGGAGRWRLPKVLQSNLNPLRLLNLPEEPGADSQARPRSLYRKASIGKIKLNKGRVRTQIVHSTSFRETEEGDGTLKSPVKSRPVSNLFG